MKVPVVKGTFHPHKDLGEYYELTDSKNDSDNNEQDGVHNAEKWPLYIEQMSQGLNVSCENLTFENYEYICMTCHSNLLRRKPKNAHPGLF